MAIDWDELKKKAEQKDARVREENRKANAALRKEPTTRRVSSPTRVNRVDVQDERSAPAKRSYAKPTGKTTRGERSTTGKLLPTKSTKPSKPAAPDKLETVKSRREPAGGKRTVHPLPDRMSPGQAFAYGTERAGALLLGAGEALTDTIGAGFYGTLAGVSSLGGLAENPVSRWARAQGNAFLDNSVTRDWEQSIEERYRPTDFERNVTGVGQAVVQMLPAIGTSKVVSAARGGASALNAAQNAIRGQQAGQALFGLQAAGQGAQEARQSGASLGQSLLYGASSGLMESLIERVSGGIPGLGKGAANGLAEKVKGVSAFLAAHPLVKQALGVVGEGGEEAVSAALEPFLKRAIYDPSAENATAEEIGQAAVMGALASGILKVGIDLPTAVGRTVANAQNVRAQVGTNEDLAGRGNDSIARGEGPFRAYEMLPSPNAGGQTNPASTGEAGLNENGLITLSDTERTNLSTGKKNRIISTFKDAVTFVRGALSDRQNVDRAYLGKLPDSVAQSIQNSTGLNVHGFGVMMNGDDIRHIIKSHGDPLAEQSRGQIAVTPDDIARIPEILAAPDHITPSKELDGKGRQAIVFEKQIGDTYITIQGVSDGKRLLQADTLYKRRARTTQNTMPGTPVGPVPVINAQGGLLQGSSSASIIPNTSVGNNPQSAPTGPERVPVQQNTQPPRRTGVDIPIAERTWKDAGSRKVNAFQYDHPELRPYFLRAAQELRSELHSGTRGERFPIKDADGYITGYTGVKRNVSEPVEQALDNAGLTYAQIEKAIDDLIADNGQENYAAAKKVELVLDNMLTDGYTSIMDGEFIEPDKAYLAARDGVNAALPAESHEYRMSEEEWTSLMGQENIGPESSAGAAKNVYDLLGSGAENLPETTVGANKTGPWGLFQASRSEFFPEGANAARPVDVPTTDPEGRRIRKTASTAMGAKAFPDEVVGDIQNMVLSGKLSYDPVTDQASIQRAQDHIRSQGFERSLEEFTSSVERGVVSKDLTTLGQQLLVNAANAGDGKATAELLSLYAQMETTAGQAVQAASILRKLDPSYQLYAVQKAVERLNWATQEKGNRKVKKGRRTAQAETGTAETAPEQGDLLKDLPGARPGSGTAQVYEAADAAKKKDIAIDPALIEKFTQQTDQAGRDAVLEEIYQNVADQVPSNWKDKWNAWRYMAMLLNPRTHIRNIAGNVGFQPVRAIKDEVGAALEGMVSRIPGVTLERTKSFAANPDLYRAAWADYQNAEAVLSGSKYNDVNSEIESRRRIFKTLPLEAARKGNSAALEAEDALFKRMTYADALAKYLQANKVSAEALRAGTVDGALLSRARDYAGKEALKATYQDKNAVSDKVVQLARMAGPFGEAVLPFKRTPANILVRGLEYSPAGLAKSLTYDLVKVRQGKMSAAEAIDHMAAGLTGTGLLALGAYLASLGLVTGGANDDEKQAAMDDLTGGQNYALNLPGGGSVTLDWLAPEALPFFMGVELVDAIGENGLTGDGLTAALGALSEPMLEMSMLQSLNDLIDNVSYSAQNEKLQGIAGSAIISYLTQAIPTIGGQIERTGEEKRMSTYTDKSAFLPTDIQYALGKASARIPGWDYHQVPYIDAWGREEPTGTLPMRAVNNFLNPAYTSFTNVTPADKEIQRLYDQTGNGAVVPRRPDRYITVDGKRIDLSGEQYMNYATMRGQTQFNMLSAISESPAYQNMTAAEQEKVVTGVYEYADSISKMKINSNYKPDKWVEKAMDSGVDPAFVVLYRGKLLSLNDQMKQREANAELRRILMSDHTINDADKNAIDHILINDGRYIPQDLDVDYTNEETFVITQMSDGAKKRWPGIKEQFGITPEQYGDAWSIYQNDELNANEKRQALREIVGTRAGALYRALGKEA